MSDRWLTYNIQVLAFFIRGLFGKETCDHQLCLANKRAREPKESRGYFVSTWAGIVLGSSPVLPGQNFAEACELLYKREEAQYLGF